MHAIRSTDVLAVAGPCSAVAPLRRAAVADHLSSLTFDEAILGVVRPAAWPGKSDSSRPLGARPLNR